MPAPFTTEILSSSANRTLTRAAISLWYTCSVPYRYGHRTGWNNHYLNIDRVIGLPGETVSVKNGLVSINSAVPENQEKLTLQPRKIPDMQWTLGTDELFHLYVRDKYSGGIT